MKRGHMKTLSRDSLWLPSNREWFTLRSGMLNLLLTERLLVRVVAIISLSQVCWHVFSPGAEINQNSVMAAGKKLFPLWGEEITDGVVTKGGLRRLYCSDTILFRSNNTWNISKSKQNRGLLVIWTKYILYLCSEQNKMYYQIYVNVFMYRLVNMSL